STGRRRFGGDA
ncbi:MAG TPA: hypothetical protein DCE32_08625, partial [Shigella sp.]|nr:hypothetical protein [Shigella sp.]